MSVIELDLHETALRCIAYSERIDADTLRLFTGKVLRREDFTNCLAVLINAERELDAEPPTDIVRDPEE